jgi:hypothetical protein
MKSQFHKLLVTNLAILGVTLLVSMMALEDKVLPATVQTYAYLIFAGIVVVFALFIAAIYILQALQDLSQERARVQLVLDAENSLAAIPRYARVRKRQDRLRIDAEGNGELEWSFEVENLDAHESDSLDFQIYSEHETSTSSWTAADPPSSIEILSLQVGSHQIANPSHTYQVKEIRHRRGSRDPLEFGVMRIPINFDDIRLLKRVRINAKMSLKKTFRKSTVDEYFVVEIPQLTDRIKVTIESSDPGLVVLPSPDNHRIHAQMGYYGTEDMTEALRQRGAMVQTDKAIVWETEYPKLGYQYMLYFQRVKAHGVQT